jgi:hypothetical protein
VVEEYTKRELSFSKDRLPALSGVASRYETVINDRYQFGLWQRGLAQSLLWDEDPWDVRRMPPDVQRAPSWSWASANFRVRWPHMDICVDPGSDPKSTDVAMLRWDTSCEDGRRILAGGRPKLIKRDWLDPMKSEGLYPHHWTAILNEAGLTIAFYLSDTWTGSPLESAKEIVSRLPDHFLILPTFAFRDTRGFSWGLVLTRQNEASDALYRRIGIFRARLTGTNNPLYFLNWRRKLDEGWYKGVQREGDMEMYTFLIE